MMSTADEQSTGESAAADLAAHLDECRTVDALIVGDAGVDMTPILQQMIDEGWTYGGTEYVAGKRVRYLTPPPGWEPS
jgi:hypothetical protein